EDIRDVGEGWFEVITTPGELSKVRSAIEQAGLEVETADVTQLPSTTVPVGEGDARRLLRLIEALDDLDDVQSVYANYDIDDEIMERVLEEV
ncbi:MAG TPA: YebC/PmpR family DNA-binding transcriptional regulator, partial [Acidimicrobiia bacterium]